MTKYSIFLADEAATEAFGRILANAIKTKGLVTLSGELGAGKTTLCRGLIRACGHQGAVKSPTYTIVEPYDFGSRRIIHFDFYRLEDPEELEYLGFRDYFDDNTLCLIEWPEKGEKHLPQEDLHISLQSDNSGRRLSWSAGTEFGQKISATIKLQYQDSVVST